MKYIKKPVVIDAERWDATEESWNRIHSMGEIRWHPGETGSESFYIDTLEGLMKVSKGDYVIKGVKGEFYPCKPDIFEQTYKSIKGGAVMNVWVISAYGGQARNVERARACMRFVAARGHLPMAGHVMLHGILDDRKPTERRIGMSIGADLAKIAHQAWVFIFEDTGVTSGMAEDIAVAADHGLPTEYLIVRATPAKKPAANISEYYRFRQATWDDLKKYRG